MFETIGIVLIYIGIAFIALGVIGIYRFRNLYPRALVASLIDTVGFITIMTGIIFYKGWSNFSLKSILIIVIVLTINPLITHSIVRSAYKSGYKVKKG